MVVQVQSGRRQSSGRARLATAGCTSAFSPDHGVRLAAVTQTPNPHGSRAQCPSAPAHALKRIGLSAEELWLLLVVCTAAVDAHGTRARVRHANSTTRACTAAGPAGLAIREDGGHTVESHCMVDHSLRKLAMRSAQLSRRHKVEDGQAAENRRNGNASMSHSA